MLYPNIEIFHRDQSEYCSHKVCANVFLRSVGGTFADALLHVLSNISSYFKITTQVMEITCTRILMDEIK